MVIAKKRKKNLDAFLRDWESSDIFCISHIFFFLFDCNQITYDGEAIDRFPFDR